MADSPGQPVATSLLLETKLYVPRWRPGSVPRGRLLQRLHEGAKRKLTLLSAPPGFGKTTLLAEWLAEAPADARPVAWLSLDQSDNHPVTFWTYLIAALQRVQPEIGASVVALLQSPQLPPIETLLAIVLNELSAMPHQLVLVLDDYHVIEASPIHDGIAYLLDHLPPQIHLVIASRADPSVPLARLRGRGDLAEIRAADLRFTPAEAAAFLNGAMGLDLSAQQVAALELRTEGWIAALQLAALSLQGRDDIAAFITAFTGNDRYIVDYLVAEVLQRQPEHVRTFLLQTSILDRLSAPLCDAVTGQERGKAMLATLERGNLFVVPLDDERRWYRYHHLFADVLRAHLLEEQPGQLAQLHGRASAWFEQNGQPSDAIRHALAANDLARAAGLVELAASALLQSRQEAMLLGWLTALPDELVSRRPVLSALYAGTLLSNGRLDGVDARLCDAEHWLHAANQPDRPAGPVVGMVVVDDEVFRRLPGLIAVYRAGHALLLGRVAETITYAQRALALVPEDDQLERGSAAGLLGLAAWTSGDLEEGHRMYTACVASLERAGHIADTFGCTLALADIRITQGRLREAMSAYERALQRATRPGAPLLRGTADMFVGMSELARERNDLPTALQQLRHSKELGEHLGLPQNPYRWCVALARIRQAEGDLESAIALLGDAERLYVGDFFPNVRPVAALKARLRVAQGRVGEALAWARAQDLSARDDLSYLREFAHITLARVLLARSTSDRVGHSILEALGLLERLVQAAEAGGRTGSVIELLVLQALAQQTRGDLSAALVPLTRALALAEPEGYVRVFVDEGAAMTVLLEAAAQRGIAPDYVQRLLATFGLGEDVIPVKRGAGESLSERELEVLRLLSTDLAGPDIARELVVSLNTMRTHTKNIYSKLGVTSRRAAVRRAEELALFSPTRRP
jgi:LuxR family transcriptional regulator, maltose regulon positive regulatory protein